MTQRTEAELLLASEFAFYLSKDLNAQVQVRVSKLLGRISSYENSDLAPGGHVRPSAAYVSAVLADEHGVLSIPCRTHYAEVDDAGALWDAWITFPSKYKELGPTAQVAVTVWEVREGASARPNGRPLGGATLRLFSKKGRLKSGSHTLTLWADREADVCWPSSTPGKPPINERGVIGQIERTLKRFHRGEFEAVPWLDALIDRAVKEARDRGEEVAERERGFERAPLRLVIQFPTFALPVLYEDTSVPGALGATGPLPSAQENAAEPSQAREVDARIERPGNIKSSDDSLRRSLASGTGRIILIHDPEVGKESPAEVKAQKLARSTRRGQMDSELKPNTEERQRIDAVLALPPGRPLSREQRELLWLFRYALKADGRALTRFLKCVDWADAAEAAQAQDLMAKWSRISVADALELLSPDYPVEAVRAHAVAALKPTGDEELLHYLLQLVQALRYEPWARQSRLAGFLVDRARRSAAIASALYWYLCAELEDPNFGDQAAEVQGMLLPRKSTGSEVSEEAAFETLPEDTDVVPQDCLPLQISLVARLRHLAEATRPYRSADRKTEILRALLAPGGACSDLTTFECPCPLDPSVKLQGLVPSECSVFKSKVFPIKLTFKVELPGISSGSAHGMETNPESRGENYNPEGSTASAVLSFDTPARLASLNLGSPSLDVKEANPVDIAPLVVSRTHTQGRTPPPTTTTLSMIFKRGDDLRQDQLVLQLISLMDGLFKREHLDLRITAYQVLPTSADSGLIEFVPSSFVLSQVMREHGSIHRFLTRHHPNPRGPYGLDPGVLANYVRSTAGYSVMTHVLGIGDRHMDNIMLTTDGRLFHIDFGYVFGRDPKFSTAPLVLNRAMVDGMGGPESPRYREFVQFCGEAFNILRKSANLLLSLIHLMAGSSIPDVREDPEKAILKVQERLRLDVDDETAAAIMEQMLAAAQAAVLPRFAEVQHRVAQGWRAHGSRGCCDGYGEQSDGTAGVRGDSCVAIECFYETNVLSRAISTQQHHLDAQNEEGNVGRAIQSAKGSAINTKEIEVIVVDGGSADNTRFEARTAGANIVMTSPRGRARQLNAGASAAHGDLLLFLHADSQLPHDWLALTERALNVRRNPRQWGCFQTIAIDDANPMTSWLIRTGVSVRTILFHRPYGDQVIFVRKSAFDNCGKFPEDWPLLEDVELTRCLRKHFGKPAIVAKAVKTSGRRWKALGLIQTTAINQAILVGHALGVPVETLAAWYESAGRCKR